MDYVVETKNLNFKYNNEVVINNLNFNIEKGSRCLLVGGNGSGKTTLLKLISGRKLTENILVLGKNSFRDTSLNFKRNLIDQTWGLRTVAFAGNNIPYVADIKVSEMMKDIQNKYPERKKELLKLLEINENWSMSYISDGQRRRVQIFLGLLRPVELVLLDEISNVLDILCREKLLDWLIKESIENKTTIIYATHIFDGLDNWYNEVLFLKRENSISSLGFFGKKENINKPIYDQVKEWLKSDEIESEKIISKSNLEISTNSAGGYAPGRLNSIYY